MTNEEKMLHHLAESESWERMIDDYERAALDHIEAEGRASHMDPKFAIARMLADNFGYKRASWKRDSHRARAVMYGVAALVERLSGQDFPRS